MTLKARTTNNGKGLGLSKTLVNEAGLWTVNIYIYIYIYIYIADIPPPLHMTALYFCSIKVDTTHVSHFSGAWSPILP